MLKKHTLTQEETAKPLNFTLPLRIAFLGGARSGKSSLISKLSMGTFRDNYYPTHKETPVLLTYHASSGEARTILDEGNGENSMSIMAHRDSIVLSPVVQHAFNNTIPRPQDLNAAISVQWRNSYYLGFCYRSQEGKGYALPHTTPVLVEMIDTPAFEPARVVPFLEASLYIKLDKETLHNLAEEPRRPVSTHPLLVASGASELNGNIDGYFFVYSAVPSSEPPEYDVPPYNKDTAERSDCTPPSSLSLLNIIKSALEDAWREYNTFRMRWNQGKEHDIFHFKSSLKTLWKDPSEVEAMRAELRTATGLVDNPTDPSDPNAPPPIWIVCTHSKSPLRSPLLVEQGAELARKWRCGWVAIDNTDENVDEVLALMIREIVERKRLQKRRR
ncbi:hypothetical protein DICA3_D03862 [Diutina catenulata]